MNKKQLTIINKHLTVNNKQLAAGNVFETTINRSMIIVKW